MIAAWIVVATLLAAPALDAVLLKSGERVEGRIVQASPTDGVRVELPDGTVRWLHPQSVERLEPAGAEPRALDAPPPATPLPSGEPAPGRDALLPVSPLGGAQPPPSGTGLVSAGRLWLGCGMGMTAPFGESARGAPALRKLSGDALVGMNCDSGLRVGAGESVGAFLDVGMGRPGHFGLAACERYGDPTCQMTTAQLGVLLRHEFTPRRYPGPWVQLGAGYEWLSGDRSGGTAGSGAPVTTISARGWVGRAAAGIDWKVGESIGLGPYAAVAFGRYARVVLEGVEVSQGPTTHGWVEGGLRMSLAP
jgi:hypothetical protein